MNNNPFHPGELYVQAQYGEEQLALSNAPRTGSTTVPTGAISFLSKQYLVIITSHDKSGLPWISALFGAPGFMTAMDTQRVEIDLKKTVEAPQDPLWTNIEMSPEVGLLVIEFATRRRLKINGRAERTEEKLIVSVDQAVSLCPKYIQRRTIESEPDAKSRSSVQFDGQELNDELVSLIASVDTMFVGSRHPDSQSSDASHRGGPKGFVQVLDSRTLRVPEYPGNGMFNTLGNFHVNPAASLIFIDFEAGRTLQMTGSAEIRWDLKGPESATKGTGRLWDFAIHRMLLTQLPTDLSWMFVDESPFLPNKILNEA